MTNLIYVPSAELGEAPAELMTEGERRRMKEQAEIAAELEEYEDCCAHEWAYTGTAYGGDDERWMGEGRCYCIKCGADGDA